MDINLRDVMLLRALANCQDHGIAPRYVVLADSLGLSRRTVVLSARRLTDNHLIRLYRRGVGYPYNRVEVTEDGRRVISQWP